MQLGDFFCYALLTITVTASYAKSETPKHQREIQDSKRLSKRDASIFIDNFPIEPVHNHRSKVIYRRLSRQGYGGSIKPRSKLKYGPHTPKYGPSKPKFGPPSKYRSPKNKQPAKKYRKQYSAKFAPPLKKRSPKPRYVPSKRPTKRPMYGPPKPEYQGFRYYTSEPTGFAEPPTEYDTQNAVNDYAEPPVDSYGAPLKNHPSEVIPTAAGYSEDILHNFNNNDFANPEQEYQQPSWHNYRESPIVDNDYANTKKRPVFVRPDEVFDIPLHQDELDNVDTYSAAVYDFKHNYKEPQILQNKKKPQFFADNKKKVNTYWDTQRLRPGSLRAPKDEVLVGGQYAEPPARYVPKFQPSAPMYEGDEDFAPPRAFTDSEVAASSAPISPYVNYKNSNMAFSPQNLNDAFSIVDK